MSFETLDQDLEIRRPIFIAQGQIDSMAIPDHLFIDPSLQTDSFDTAQLVEAIQETYDEHKVSDLKNDLWIPRPDHEEDLHISAYPYAIRDYDINRSWNFKGALKGLNEIRDTVHAVDAQDRMKITRTIGSVLFKTPIPAETSPRRALKIDSQKALATLATARAYQRANNLKVKVVLPDRIDRYY